MGLRGPIAKPDAERRGHRRSKLIVVDGELRAAEPPPYPGGLRTRAGREHWDRLWTSRVARHWDSASDLDTVVDLALAEEEARRIRAAISRAGRLSTGSTHQAVLNPLYGALDRAEKMIGWCRDRLGLHPMGRLRLGLLGVTGAKTAAELNRMVEGADHGDVADDPDLVTLAADFEPG